MHTLGDVRVQQHRDMLSPGCNLMYTSCVVMVAAVTWVAPCTHVHTYMYLYSCSPPCLVSCVGVLCVVFSQAAMVGQGERRGRRVKN